MCNAIVKKESFASGVSYMLLSAAGLALVGLFGKIGAPLLSLEALIFWRYLAALPLCIGFMWFIGNLRSLFPFRNPTLHFLRAFFVLGAQYSFYYYIQRASLLNGMVLLSLGPLFIPLIEWILTRSPIGRSTWAGLIVSFAGMLCVLQPDAGIFSLLSLIGVLAGLCQGCSQVIFGLNAKNERADLSVLYTFILCLAISLIPYLLTIDTPGEETATPLFLLFTILGMGAASVLNQLARAWAYSHGTPSRLSTFLYFSILLSGLFDWAVFHKKPNLLSLIGAILVISGGLLKIYLRSLILRRRVK
jgi:drug/metabolite transporter (DMT)-like permease